MNNSLFLVRHGTTRANLENRFAGKTSEPLHKDGIRQMKELGIRLMSSNISRIICGPLPRTRQSAEILAETLKTPITIDNALTEIHIPHWDGLSKQAIRDRYNNEYPNWLNSPDKFALPGCEKLADVQIRGVKTVEKYLKTLFDGTALLVSHLIVVRCIVLHYKNLPIKDFRKIIIDNGSVTKFEKDITGQIGVAENV